MEGIFQTDRGQVRKLNEDSGGIHFNKNNQLLALVADGMGGHNAGEVASEVANEIIKKAWAKEKELTKPEQIEKWLHKNIIKANSEIYKYATKNEQYKGMGTTLVVAVCTDEFFSIAHVGDSRGYLLNENGFKQLTDDHSLVNELVKSGEITENDAKEHPRKNVLLKALGTEEEITPEVKTISWEDNNYLLLCSDGLSNKIAQTELASKLKENKSLSEITNNLMLIANQRGGEDNISIALITKAGEEKC